MLWLNMAHGRVELSGSSKSANQFKNVEHRSVRRACDTSLAESRVRHWTKRSDMRNADEHVLNVQAESLA